MWRPPPGALLVGERVQSDAGTAALDKTATAAARAPATRPTTYRSKADGEAAVRAVVARGLDAVIVNPTGVIGPYDFGPSRMGLTIKMLRSRKIPVNRAVRFRSSPQTPCSAPVLADGQPLESLD